MTAKDPRVPDWLDEIEAQIDDSVPHYVPRLIATIRTYRRAVLALANSSEATRIAARAVISASEDAP